MSGFCSDECAALDLDGHGGRTFLRVLLHLTMHDYPPLVSGALHLLFRHFSQRQEVLQAFKQVVIADHKHYLFIKRLNLMRLYCNSLWKNWVAVGLWLEAERGMQVWCSILCTLGYSTPFDVWWVSGSNRTLSYLEEPSCRMHLVVEFFWTYFINSSYRT